MNRGDVFQAIAWSASLGLAWFGEWPSAIGLALGLILGLVLR